MFATPEQMGKDIIKMMSRMHDYNYDKRLKVKNKIKAMFLSGNPILHSQGVQGGYGLLADAIEYRVDPLVDYCLDNNIDLEANGSYGRPPIIAALETWEYAGAVAGRLIEKGVNVEVTARDGRTTLMMAIEKSQLVNAMRLSGRGLSFGDVTANGYCPLRAAIHSGSVDNVNFVLGKNHHKDLKHGGIGYVFSAVMICNKDIFNLLLKKGFSFDPHERNSDKQTMLDRAASRRGWNSEHAAFYDLLKEKYDAIAEIEAKRAEDEARAARTGWKLVTPDTVCHIDEQDVIGYKVTEIFNFRAGLYTRINHHLDSKNDSSAVVPFSQIDQVNFLNDAADNFERLGGTMPTSYNDQRPHKGAKVMKL